MGLIRSKSTPVGLAEAQKLKRKGRSLNDLIEKKTNELYGKQTNFKKLNESQKIKFTLK
ncbi:hypothetical protein [Photobacterium nomapromontoriensis]|uniref:hypothetical protein n=1 Tax=Photobacterium nomapromontoriensis TaxID=2910237 RepID=UPI003D15021C